MNHTVLYAEDDANDALLFERAFQRIAPNCFLKLVSDGQDAIDYLAAQDALPHRPLPAVTLVDLNMPRRSGFEVIQWVRAKPAFHAMPVIVFSSSNTERDQSRARELGANAYQVKPLGSAEYRNVIKTILDRWLPPINSSPVSPDTLAPGAPAGGSSPSRPTAIYVRRESTGLYLRAHDSWVLRRQEARVFAGPLEALCFCVRGRLHDVVLTFDTEGEPNPRSITPFRRGRKPGDPVEDSIHSLAETLLKASHAEA